MSVTGRTMTPTPQSPLPDNIGQADFSQAQSVVVRLEKIHPYERNPRQGTNPEYERIKASIRATGLDQPLTITQRPGATDYIVHSGGNTRLQVLKSLFEETGEDRYATVACLFKPWHRESDVLLAHLRENDLRGGLTFIDKARAVLEIKELLEAECQIEALSQRHLESVLQQGGYALSSGLISRMGYAVQTLLPLIPQALNAGLGRPQVQKIRALERAARQVWQAHALGAATTFDSVFAALCERYDDPDWDTELLRNALESEIAEEAEVSVHVIRVELDARIEGRAVTLPPPEEDPDVDEDNVDWLDRSRVSTEAKDQTETGPLLDNPEETDSDLAPDTLDDGAADIDPAQDDPAYPDNISPPELPEGVGVSGPADLKSLRARAWTLATRLARRNGLGDLVVPLSGQGLGFTLRDVPDSALADQLDEETLGQLSLVWWQLAACAELTIAPASNRVPHLSRGSLLEQALQQQDLTRLFNSVWTPDPGQTGHRLWRRLGDKDWMDLLNLMDCYRRMHRLAEERQLDLWAPS